MSQSKRPRRLDGEFFATRRQGLLDERYFEIKDMGYVTPCWVWFRTTVGERGYGQAWSIISKKRMVAHHAVWEERIGAWPDEKLQADHLCRVRLCVNPEHIEPVTQSVNLQRGSGAKLSEEQIEEMHRLHHDGESIRGLARKFSVNRDTVKRHLRLGGRHGTGDLVDFASQ